MVYDGRIRLMVMCSSLGVGGAQVQLSRLIPALNRDIFDVQIGYYHNKTAFPLEVLKKTDVPVTFFGTETWNRKEFFRHTISYFKENKFDIVHSWFSSSNHYGRLSAMIAGVPVIIGGLRGVRGFENYWPLVYSSMNRFCSGWIVNSRSLKELALKKMFCISDDNIKIVHNGIELSSPICGGPIRHSFYDGLKSSRPVVGIIGRLHPVKNHILFLEMVRLLKLKGVVADYWIVGDGEMREPLEKQVVELGLQDCVKFLGLRLDVDEALKRMDLVVLTSDSESCPNALLEAMNASLPVVSTKCTSMEDIIEEGYNGFTVPLNSPVPLAEKVEMILLNPDLRRDFGLHSRWIIEQRFSVEVATASLEQAYYYFLRKKSGRVKSIREKLRCMGNY